MADTPVNRATINQFTIESLDQMLDGIRERRLTRVKRMEEIAKAKADDVRLLDYMKFEKEYARVMKLMDKHVEAETKIETAIHKLRVMVMAMSLT